MSKTFFRFLTKMVVMTTIVWSLGISALIPNVAYAITAITVAGPFDLIPSNGMYPPASSFDVPIIRFSLTQSASGETLSSVAVTVTSTVFIPNNNNTLADHINAVKVWQDSNGNGYFDPQSDALAGTQAVVKVATSTTVITTGSNNSIAASTALPTSFFVTISTDSTWASPDSIYVNMAAAGIATSVESPTITAPLVGSRMIMAGSGGWEGGGFSVANVTYVNATTIDISFTDNLDLNSGNATSTGNYSFSGAGASAVTSVTLLPDNKSVRVSASGATLVSIGTSLITITNAVKNIMGMANTNTSATPIYSGVKPFALSEIKIGASTDQYDEFVEIYNRSGSVASTSSLKLHIINALGTMDQNVSLTWRAGNAINAIPIRGFLLIAPADSSLAATADATYTTSSLLQLVPSGAVYISDSAASSTAVTDKVCWGANAGSNCEGTAASSLSTNDGTSIERKAFNDSTSATMVADTNGNSVDTQNNSFDFVTRATPGPQNSSAAETPSGGSYGGANNQAPSIQHAPLFRASASSTLNIVARISDDGGPLPAGNTMMIYCVTDTTCTPVSSTPIYGISIGSGWYKFSPTTTPWSGNKIILKYYLQANDSATPAKSKVFTADPNFDTVTYDTTGTGIQTQALQVSKALAINLVQGNLGGAFFNGTVQTSAGVVISGATVWIDGTQFAATTGNDGSFSFSNVGPSGGIQLRVAKEGYMDQNISTFLPPSGFVDLGAITLYSGMMGQGGDFSLPKVMSSFPMPGMMGFPTQSPTGGSPTMDLNFNKTMDTTAIIDADASDASSNIYLTEAGSGTKIAGAVTAPTATSARFTPTAALTVGKNYTLFLTPAVKDTVGNPVQGNGPGGIYVLSFGTTGEMFTGGGGGGGMGNSFPPFVIGSQPAPGKANVALNTKMFVSFSESLQNTSGNLGNVKLYKVTNAYTASESKSEVTAIVRSMDSSNKIVILAPDSVLVASANYRVEVTGGLVSSKGISLGNPTISGYATQVMYKSDFNTGSATDITVPTVSGTIPADAATGISPTAPIVVVFSEAINPATITDSSLTIKLGSNALAGTLTYDTTSWKATFVPTYALTATSTYTITITTDVKDLAGNSLVLLQRSFITGNADTGLPAVLSAQANDFALKVSFSKPMLSVTASDSNYASSVLKPANYSIRVVSSAGATLSTVSLPATATLTYDSASRSVSLNGLPTISGFIAGTTLLNIVASNVKDIGFNALDTTLNAATTTAQSSAKSGGFGSMMPTFDAGGNMMQGGMGMGGPPPMVGTFMTSGIGFAPGVKVYPFNKMAGASTIYGIEIPVSYQIPATGFIDITFPDGTDVSQAKKDTASPPNNDLNGPGPGVVVFGTAEGTLPTGWTTGGASSDGVIVDATSRKVRVILGAVATRSENSDTHDFLRLDIAQVVNSIISSGADTSGSSATVETKKADGTVLETLSSTSFFTNAAGSFTVRGRVLAGASGINGINVFLMSPMTGPQSSSTANSRFGVQDGEFMFQNLVAGNYMLGAEQFAKSGATSYTAGFPAQINVNATNCSSNICSQNISVVDASTGVAVTLSISGTFSNDAIDIFAGGPGSFRKTTSTLDGVLTSNTSNSIKLNANGVWMVGFGPQMSTEMFGKGGPSTPTTWMPPKPQEVQVSGCPSACSVNPSTLTFNVSKANNTVKYTVKDASSNAIANANVFAYSPVGGFGIDSNANADGTGSISMATGTYKIGASVSGMPSGIERSIMINNNYVFIDGSSTGILLSSMTNAMLILTISKPSYTISGKVTDGTNPVASAPVSAYRTDGPGHSETFTNSSGEYTLYVSNGTWKVQAFTPDYGKLPEKTITVSSASVSGQNFEPNTSAVNYATITKSVGNDTDADGVFDSGEGTSNVQVIVEGTTGDMNNDGDTTDTGENASYINNVMSDTNGSSTMKLPPGTYTMTAFSPTQGEMSSSTQSIVVNGAGTVTTAPYDILAPKTGAVTINILDSNGNATSSMKAVVEFMQIGGKTDKVESFSGVASSTISLPQYDVANALNAVTSTNPTNMYLMNVTIPGVSDSNLIVYGADSNTVLATSTAASGFWKVEVDANTETINIKLPAINYVSGTVKDADGTAVPGATVHLENSSTNEKVDVQADTSGNYSAKLSSATYLVSATKDGYIDTASSIVVSANGALADSATTMTVASYTISGTITAGSAVASGATVRAEKLGGGIVTATTATDGTYSLRVINGNWKVSTAADGYTEGTYSSIVAVNGSSVSSINITLSTTATSLSGSTSQSLTPQTGGSMNDSSAGASVKASEADLASSANSYTVSDKETSNVVGGSAGTPISNEAKTIGSYDNDGNTVTLLNNDVSIGASYSNSDMTSALGTLTLTKLEKVQMASWDDTADNWQTLPTTIGYKDSSGKFIEASASASTIVYTGQTSHFSSFNPIAPSDGMAPGAPTSVAAVASDGSVSITWAANSEGDLQGYDIYRSTSANGTYSSIGSATTNSYTNSTVVNGTTYYYKITATDTGGLESEFSSSSNAASPVAPVTGGGSAVITQPSPTVTTASIAVSGNANALTSLDVVLKFNVADAVQMAISEKSDFAGSSWESYVTTKTYKLSDGIGAKKLYIKFRTALGGVSEVKILDLNVASISATPSIAPATTPAASAVTVKSEVKAPSVPGEITIAKPESKVVITNVSAASYQPGDTLKFSYNYQNDTAKIAQIKIVRQLLNSKNKVVSTASAVKTIKAGKSFKADIAEAINNKLAAGEYIVKVKIFNAKTNKLIDENSFSIQVEKLKKKMFVMGAIGNSDSDIAFDEVVLAKVKSNVSVPTLVNFRYSYTNNTDTKQVIKMVRQLLDANGKVMQAGSGKWTMIPGEKDSLNTKQPVAANLSAGNYSIRIVAYDWKTKELLAENSLGFSIELK